jgi:hypothetical protein
MTAHVRTSLRSTTTESGSAWGYGSSVVSLGQGGGLLLESKSGLSCRSGPGVGQRCARRFEATRSTTVVLPAGKVPSSGMADQSLSEQAREAVRKAIIKSAPTVGNSPAGVRDLAEAYALLERDLVPNAGVVQTRT